MPDKGYKPSPFERREEHATLGDRVTLGGKIYTRDQILSEVEGLIKEVENELKSTRKEPAYMLWRLVDAAGLVSEFTSHTAVGRQEAPTGRGYFIGWAFS